MTENETPKTPAIYGQVAQICKDCGAIAKGQTNQQQGFAFRGIDDVLREMHPHFAKNECVLKSEILKHDIRKRKTRAGGEGLHHQMKVRWKVVSGIDGSAISTETTGEAFDAGDKGAAKCMSISLKQALFNMFLIPTEDTPDADADAYDDFERQSNVSHVHGQHRVEDEPPPPRRAAAANQQNYSGRGWEDFVIPFKGPWMDRTLYEYASMDPDGCKKTADWFINKKRRPEPQYLPQYFQEKAWFEAAVAWIEVEGRRSNPPPSNRQQPPPVRNQAQEIEDDDLPF
jgi:hypothetical protein